MYCLDDTIAAIATPIGDGGIGIVRISGPDARRILRALFVPGRAGTGMPCGVMRHGWIVAGADGEPIDEVLAVFLAAPGTYTRQDVAEIHCHGGIVPVRRALAAVLSEGARGAEPGEFTLRAFANGRIDLAQAEAVLEVVRSRTERGLDQAVSQLRGALSGRIREARQLALAAYTYLEAMVDFAEDAIPWENPADDLERGQRIVSELLQDTDRGIILRQGVRAAIVGRPNVGKSSLLNALLRADRAIVTPTPGTTRDTLEETVNIGGAPVVLIDTAGMASCSEDAIERLGIERSRRALSTADLCLLVVDGSEPLALEDCELATLTEGRQTLVVVNKADLPERVQLTGFADAAPRVRVSALTGEGLTGLERTLADIVLGGTVSANGAPLVASERHRDALRRAEASLAEAIAGLRGGQPGDLVSIAVRDAVDSLGEITGETVGDDLLNAIFSRFCVGK